MFNQLRMIMIRNRNHGIYFKQKVENTEELATKKLIYEFTIQGCENNTIPEPNTADNLLNLVNVVAKPKKKVSKMKKKKVVSKKDEKIKDVENITKP